VERRKGLFLQAGFKINQEVAAADEVHP
jgi:hypothetical protein